MKYTLPFLCIIAITVNAQQKNPLPASQQKNFYTIRDQFYNQFDKGELRRTENEKEEPGDGILEKFHRWEWLMTTRTFPSGNLPDPAITAKERVKYQTAHPEMNTLRNSSWQPIGSAEVPGNGGG